MVPAAQVQTDIIINKPLVFLPDDEGHNSHKNQGKQEFPTHGISLTFSRSMGQPAKRAGHRLRLWRGAVS